MKKAVSFLAGLALLLSCVPASVSAEEAVPADIGQAAYDQLMEVSWKYDKDSNNIITMEELKQAELISLDLTGVEDISWFADLDKCTRVLISNGDITDFSVLKEMDSLTDLFLDKIPIDDISFIKELELDICEITDMPQIDLDKRLAVMRCPDVTLEKGYMTRIGAYPDNILWKHEYSVVIDDPSVAEESGSNWSVFGPIRGIYAVSPGETDYHVIVDGEERFKGHITVTEQDVYAPALRDTKAETRFDILSWDKAYGMLRDGTLYGIQGKDINVIETDVKDFMYASSKARMNQSYTTDLLLKNDGTLYVNKEPVTDQKFSAIAFERAVTEDGQLWVPYKIEKMPWVYKIADNFREFPADGKEYYISKSGEVVYYYYRINDDEKAEVTVTPTGIMNPKWSMGGIFIDENDVLWSVRAISGVAEPHRIAENVESVGDYYTESGTARCYKTFDGHYYDFGGEEEKVTGEQKENDYSYRYYNGFKLDYYAPATETAYCIISDEDVLAVEWHDQHFSMSGVEKVITRRSDKESGQNYMFILRRDGSIWRYCLETKEIKEMTLPGAAEQPATQPATQRPTQPATQKPTQPATQKPTQPATQKPTQPATQKPTQPATQKPTQPTVSGDISGDGKFNIADAVTVQSWLLGDSSVKMKNWKAADFVSDGVLDTFDYVVMCRRLTEKK